jgi:hypothetical protein
MFKKNGLRKKKYPSKKIRLQLHKNLKIKLKQINQLKVVLLMLK